MLFGFSFCFFSPNPANLDLCGGVCPRACEEEGEPERGCVDGRVREPCALFL